MGALDKRIFSGVAMVSALLFVVSAVLLLTGGESPGADSNGVSLYVLTVSGILAVVYSVALIIDRSSFVRSLSGVIAALAGVVYLAVPFVAGSSDTMIALAAIIGAVAMIADMLALWVSRVYGAMYVTAVLAALEIIMGALHFINEPQNLYYVIALVVFGVWLALSGYVSGFVKIEKPKQAKGGKKNSDRPSSKSCNAKSKAKAPESKGNNLPKVEKKPVDVPETRQDPQEDASKAAPVAPTESQTPKVEKKPVRTVELPKKSADQLKSGTGSKPVETPASKPESKPTEGQPKSSNDFMKKLMTSQNANRVKQTRDDVKSDAPAVAGSTTPPANGDAIPRIPAVPETQAEPVPEADVVEEIAIDSGTSEEVEESSSSSEVQEPAALVSQEEQTEEADSEEPVEEEPVEESIDEHAEEPAEEPAGEEHPEVDPEEPIDEPVEESVEEADPEEPVEETPADIQEESPMEPDWSVVTHDASQSQETDDEGMMLEEQETSPEEPVIDVTSEEATVPDAPVEEGLEADITEETEVTTEADSMPEPVVEEHPVSQETPEEPEQPSESESPVIAQGASVDEVEVPEAVSEDDAPGEDLYTDYSPEAVVRRAAWNKGLRCRRNYGPHGIPVAFVKGKVAVYVDSPEADTSVDSELEAEGWTVIRYDATTITDGKAQGEEIAAAVKANARASKSSKKKGKK